MFLHIPTCKMTHSIAALFSNGNPDLDCDHLFAELNMKSAKFKAIIFLGKNGCYFFKVTVKNKKINPKVQTLLNPLSWLLLGILYVPNEPSPTAATPTESQQKKS